jgi:hypothetical protein
MSSAAAAGLMPPHTNVKMVVEKIATQATDRFMAHLNAICQ